MAVYVMCSKHGECKNAHPGDPCPRCGKPVIQTVLTSKPTHIPRDLGNQVGSISHRTHSDYEHVSMGGRILPHRIIN
jgi:hypothetical protein